MVRSTASSQLVPPCGRTEIKTTTIVRLGSDERAMNAHGIRMTNRCFATTCFTTEASSGPTRKMAAVRTKLSLPAAITKGPAPRTIQDLSQEYRTRQLSGDE